MRSQDLAWNMNDMFKFIVANFSKVLFLLFVFHVNVSYAYVIDIVKLDSRSYSIKGYINSSELNRVTNVKYWPGVNIFYHTPEWRTAANYEDGDKNCPDNAEEALKVVNNVLAHAVMVQLNFTNYKDSHISITCKVRDGLGWRFDNYVGPPTESGSPSCQLTAPLDVNFGTVTVEDNNKVIEKQVTIKCDKATKMRLTLEGDNKTNLLNLSDTVIKLGVGGDTQTKIYDIEEGKVSTANLNFTLTDTGNTPGVKKGYVLLVSEIP